MAQERAIAAENERAGRGRRPIVAEHDEQVEHTIGRIGVHAHGEDGRERETPLGQRRLHGAALEHEATARLFEVKERRGDARWHARCVAAAAGCCSGRRRFAVADVLELFGRVVALRLRLLRLT